MFASFRRYQHWIWLIAVIVVIPTFVIYFTPESKSGFGCGGRGAAPAGDFGSINGVPIPLEEYRNSFREMQIGYFLRSGKWPANDENMRQTMEREAISRAYLVRKLTELDIHPSDKAVARVTRERIADYPYATLEKEILQPQGLKLADFERYVRTEAGIQQLVSSAAISSRLVDPREAEALYRKEHQELATDVAVFWATNFMDRVVITNGAIEGYFSNRLAVYRTPQRIQVSYVEFTASNYLADADKQLAQRATNLTAYLDEFYLKRGTNTFTNELGKVLSEAEAKAKLKEDVRKDFALTSARRAAAELGNLLISDSSPNVATNLDRHASTKGYTVKVSPPFDYSQGLENTEFPAAFREKALALQDATPLAFSPIVGTNAVYIIALKQRIPPQEPVFETVKEKVATDYKNFMARDMALKAGQSFHTNLTNGLLLKKSFDVVAAEASARVIKVSPFSSSTTTLTNLDPKLSLQMLQRLTADLEPGQASRFVPSADGGAVVYLREKVPLTEEKVKAGLPDFIGNLRAYRQSEAFNQWFRKMAEKDKVMPPKRELAAQQGGTMPEAQAQ